MHLEIFGSGGYALARDSDKALSPIAHQVRFWGHQRNVGAVYAQLDYLMTGLPEKEALGLNIIEAQARDPPVLAVKAPPLPKRYLKDKADSSTVTRAKTGEPILRGCWINRLICSLRCTLSRPASIWPAFHPMHWPNACVQS